MKRSTNTNPFGRATPNWEGWHAMELAGDFYWVSKATPPTPFKIVEGEQLVAE